MRTSNTAALSRYSFHNGSSFLTSSFKIFFHVSCDGPDGAERVVDMIGKWVEIVNVADRARPIQSYLNSQINWSVNFELTLNLKALVQGTDNLSFPRSLNIWHKGAQDPGQCPDGLGRLFVNFYPDCIKRRIQTYPKFNKFCQTTGSVLTVLEQIAKFNDLGYHLFRVLKRYTTKCHNILWPAAAEDWLGLLHP